MTITTAQKLAQFNDRAMDAIRQADYDCWQQTKEEKLPFNTHPKFNLDLAKAIDKPSFVLTNGHWNYLIQRAKANLEPDGTGNCVYTTSNISSDSFGAAVQYVLMLLVFDYGEACAVKALYAADPSLVMNSTTREIATTCAHKLVGHQSKYACKYQTIQDAAIARQLSAAQVKVHIRKMIQCQVVNQIKEVRCQPELDEFNAVEYDDYHHASDDDFEVEDQIQLEYLREFMHRAIDDLSPVAKLVVDVYRSDEGTALLRETDVSRTTFESQLQQLKPLTDLNEYETKEAGVEIVNSFWQLLRLSQERVYLTRTQIKNKAMRSYVRRGIKRYESEAELENTDFVETRIYSPYISDEDYDLMVEAACNESFFVPTGSAFALN